MTIDVISTTARDNQRSDVYSGGFSRKKELVCSNLGLEADDETAIYYANTYRYGEIAASCCLRPAVRHSARPIIPDPKSVHLK